MTATHGGVPSDIPELPVPAGPQSIVGLLVAAKIVGTNSEAIRKIREGAVKLDGEKVTDTKAAAEVTAPRVLQMGSKKFVRLTPA